MTTNRCKCGQLATNLVIIKGDTIALCAKHVAQLEQFLGEKLEPLTNQSHQSYEPRI